MNQEEHVRTSASSSRDIDGNIHARSQADAMLKQGNLYVEHTSYNGQQRSKITLDTNRDGTADYTFIDDGKLSTYFTTGDRAVALMEPSAGQHATQDIRALLSSRDLSVYRQVAEFVMSPSNQHLPHVSKPNQR